MAIDLTTVPLIAASVASRQVIATMLNPVKVLPSDNGLPRDWRGLAHLLELDAELVQLLVSYSDPSTHILKTLEKNEKNITVKHFQTMMEQMDRWDVIDDTEALFESDAERYLEHQQRAQESADPVDERDQEILTLGDIHRLKQGLETQCYDAFLLYAEEDIDFVNEMVEKLETQFKLKLCLKDRDLVVGVEFEHEAIMKLISERCNRLIIIVSPNFLKSPANSFFLNYTQALSIEKRQRKIIPCIYKSCELPLQLKYVYNLDYNRRGLYDFWGKLRDSIQSSNSASISTPIGNNSKAQEITAKKTTLSDNCRNISHTSQKTSEEVLKYPHQNSQNCNGGVITKDIIASNVSNKKNKTLSKWEKITFNWKTKRTKETDVQSTSEEIVQNLPSVDNLDSLDSSSTHVHKNKKKNLFSKLTKKKISVKL